MGWEWELNREWEIKSRMGMGIKSRMGMGMGIKSRMGMGMN